jgi:hypothetical protein
MERASGALRTEAESGVSAQHALFKFENACVRFEIAQKDLGRERKGGRREAKLYLARLSQALRELQAATASVTSLIGDDLYDKMPERVLDELTRENPRSEEEQATAASFADFAPDPLEWRTQGHDMGSVAQASRWATQAGVIVDTVSKGYHQPGRDRGTAQSLLASDVLYLLRLLDRSDSGPVRPVRPKRLQEWVEFLLEVVDVQDRTGMSIACKHAVAKAGPEGTWEHPERPWVVPREIFRLVPDRQGNVKRVV